MIRLLGSSSLHVNSPLLHLEFKSDIITSRWHPWWEHDVLAFQWQVNCCRTDRRHQRRVSRLRHPFPSPDYLSARLFFSLADFLPFSPNAEPGSRLERPSTTCWNQLELLKMKCINWLLSDWITQRVWLNYREPELSHYLKQLLQLFEGLGRPPINSALFVLVLAIGVTFQIIEALSTAISMPRMVNSKTWHALGHRAIRKEKMFVILTNRIDHKTNNSSWK